MMTSKKELINKSDIISWKDFLDCEESDSRVLDRVALGADHISGCQFALIGNQITFENKTEAPRAVDSHIIEIG